MNISSLGIGHQTSRKLVTNYYNNVFSESHRKQPKKKGSTFVKKSIRQLNRSWREKSLPLSKKHEVMIDSLLDIGKNMDKVTCNEKIFYEDQNGLRKCRISEEIDLEYAEAKELEETEPKKMLGRQAKEEQFILGDTEETLLQNNSFDKTNQLDVSLNRSGCVCNTVIAVDVGLQFDSAVVRPRIRKVRSCTNKIKSPCAEVSVKCNISTQASCIAVQTVCNTLYGHKYYLTKDKVIQNDPSLKMHKTTGPKPSKRVKSAEKLQVPISVQDYAVYENVLPSPRVLNDHKHVLAIQHEKEAATALN